MNGNVVTDMSLASAQEVVERILTDTYDDHGVLTEKILTWLFDVWEEVSEGQFRQVEIAFLPIAPSTRTIKYPANCRQVYRVGYDNGCGRFAPLSTDMNLMPRIGIQIPDQQCSTCGQDDLRKKMEFEQVEETVYYNEVPYTKKTTKIIRGDGKYVQEIVEPVPQYDETGFTGVIMSTTSEFLCELDVAPCGCVAPTTENVQRLCSCGSSLACLTCHNSDQYYPVSGGGMGSYQDFPESRFIQFSPETCLSHAYVLYVSRAPKINGQYFFPREAKEVLAAGVYFRSIEKKRGIQRGDKNDAEHRFYKELKKLSRRRLRHDIDEILDILSRRPRIIPN